MRKVYRFVLLDELKPQHYLVKTYHTVRSAAKMIGFSKANLQQKIARGTVEHVYLTDWDRNDTEQRPMVGTQVILWEREKYMAKKEKRKPSLAKIDVIDISNPPKCFTIPQIDAAESPLVQMLHNHGFSFTPSQMDLRVMKEKSYDRFVEIYKKDNWVFQAIPTETREYHFPNPSSKKEIYTILWRPQNSVVASIIANENWKKMRAEILEKQDLRPIAPDMDYDLEYIKSVIFRD